MPTDIRPLAGKIADVEKELGRALALTRVVGFAARNRQTEALGRTTTDLILSFDRAIDPLHSYARDARQALDESADLAAKKEVVQ